jgi:cytochrome c
VVLAAAFLLGGLAMAQDPGTEQEGVSMSEVETAGREIYGRCLACHAIGYDRVGPRHCGLFGRRAGSVAGFAYSDAMRNSGIVWGSETLDRFLADPIGVVPGTLMTYAGVSDRRERDLLIGWLKSSTSPKRCRATQ